MRIHMYAYTYTYMYVYGDGCVVMVVQEYHGNVWGLMTANNIQQVLVYIYMCIYICMYIYMYVYNCIYIYVYIYTDIHNIDIMGIFGILMDFILNCSHRLPSQCHSRVLFFLFV